MIADQHWITRNRAELGSLTVLLLIFAGPYVLVASCVGTAARDRGRSGVGWTIAALLLSPPLAAILLIAAGDSPEKQRADRKALAEEIRLAVRARERVPLGVRQKVP